MRINSLNFIWQEYEVFISVYSKLNLSSMYTKQFYKSILKAIAVC